MQYFFILLALALASTASEENEEQGAGTGLTEKDCESGILGADGYCTKGQEPEFGDDEVVELHNAIDLTNLKFHAQTIKLQAGAWCVSVRYDQQLGPRLLTLLWFQYGPKVAYSVLRNKAPYHEDYDFNLDFAQVHLSILAFHPFTMDAILMPGALHVAKEHISLKRGFCTDEHDSIDLDGARAHADRLLTCHMNSSHPRCRWNREKEEDEEEGKVEEEGASEPRWLCPFAVGGVEQEGDRFLEEERAVPFYQAWPLTEEQKEKSGENHDVERRFLVSEWLRPRAGPGCLRVLLYAWGPPPQAVVVHVHQRGSPLTRAKAYPLGLLPKYVITWNEGLIPVEVEEDGEYRLIVDFIGGRWWAGSLILDDISEELQPCVGESAYILNSP